MIIFWILVVTIFVCFGLIAFRGAPYVPTHRKDIHKAFTDLYPVTPQDVVVDIGSGDGIVLREVSRLGARAIGYELNPILVGVSRLLCRGYDGVEVRLADFWLANLPEEATVFYAFSVSRDMPKMAKKLQVHADRTGRPVAFVSYGSSLEGKEAAATAGAHTLYHFAPLQGQ